MHRFAWALLCIFTFDGSAAADVLERIRTEGVIHLGVRADAPPFSYLDERTEPAGLAVRLCDEVAQRIARQLGTDDLRVEYRIVSADGRFRVLEQGLTDLHCGPASATLRRREFLDFSLLYFVDGAAIASRGDSYERVFENRSGRIGMLDGTTAVGIAEDLIRRNGLEAELVRFPVHHRGLKALAEDSIDLYLGDQAILLFQIEALGLSDKISVREDVLSFEPYALVMRRGESGLRLAVDRALSEIYEEGLIYEMIEAEMGNYPLSEEGQAIYQIVGLPD